MSARNERKTYSPVYRWPMLFDAIGSHDFESIPDIALDSEYAYERIALDRFLLIWADMREGGCRTGMKMLDVGCNVGTLSCCFAAAGFRVLGIDSDIAPQVQGYYPLDSARAREQMAKLCRANRPTFKSCTLAELLARSPSERFDYVLLLSVVHQWWEGYLGEGAGKQAKEFIERQLVDLLHRTSTAIYLENPEYSFAASPHSHTLPAWFAEQCGVRSVERIGHSVDAGGQFRPIYRISTGGWH